LTACTPLIRAPFTAPATPAAAAPRILILFPPRLFNLFQKYSIIREQPATLTTGVPAAPPTAFPAPPAG